MLEMGSHGLYKTCHLVLILENETGRTKPIGVGSCVANFPMSSPYSCCAVPTTIRQPEYHRRNHVRRRQLEVVPPRTSVSALRFVVAMKRCRASTLISQGTMRLTQHLDTHLSRQAGDTSAHGHPRSSRPRLSIRKPCLKGAKIMTPIRDGLKFRIVCVRRTGIIVAVQPKMLAHVHDARSGYSVWAQSISDKFYNHTDL